MSEIQDPALDELEKRTEKWGSAYNPEYGIIIKKRLLLYHEARKSKALQKAIIEKCSQDSIKFLSNFGWGYDPRLLADNKPALVPFIPFQKQIEYIHKRDEIIAKKQNLFVLKSRDCGASYISCFHQLHKWLFIPGFSGGLASRKEKLVDEKGNPDTLFEKLRMMLNLLPKWLKPEDYLDAYCRLINYENGNSITGEAGDEIGRGARKLLYEVDEAGYVPHLETTARALSNTATSIIYFSSSNGKGNYFGKKYLDEKSLKFFISWEDDPRKDEKWLAEQEEKFDRFTLQREVFCSLEEPSESSLFDYKWLQKCKKAFSQVFDSTMPVISGGLDVAGLGADEAIFTVLIGGCIVLAQIKLKKNNVIEVAKEAHQLCLMYGVQILGVDTSGNGEGTVAYLEGLENRLYDLVPIRGNAACTNMYFVEYDTYAKNIFNNLRTQAYYIISRKCRNTFQVLEKIRQWDQLECISFNCEDVSLLFSQLESVEIQRKLDGKMKLPSKEEMRSQGIKSPDRADSLIYSYICLLLSNYQYE